MQLAPTATTTRQGTDYYSPALWARAGLAAKGCVKQLRAAYAVAGLEPPIADATAVRTALFNEKSTTDVLTDLEADIRHGGVDIEKYISGMQRASAVESLLGLLTDFEQRNAKSQALAMSAQAAEDLRSYWVKVNKELAKVSRLLPEGDLALDRGAVFDLDANVPYKRAVALLGELGALASIYHDQRERELSGRLRAVLLVADVERFSAGYAVSYLSNSGKEPIRAERAALREMAKVAGASKDLAIIGIARGDYPGIALKQPIDDADIDARIEAAGWGLTNTRTDSW